MFCMFARGKCYTPSVPVYMMPTYFEIQPWPSIWPTKRWLCAIKIISLNSYSKKVPNVLIGQIMVKVKSQKRGHHVYRAGGSIVHHFTITLLLTLLYLLIFLLYISNGNVWIEFCILEKKYVIESTYIVPATFVLMWVWPSSLSFARPKSEILASKSLSSSILLALISRCTILIADSSCRYARPLAIPRQILRLVGQSNASLYSSTGSHNTNYSWVLTCNTS